MHFTCSVCLSYYLVRRKVPVTINIFTWSTEFRKPICGTSSLGTVGCDRKYTHIYGPINNLVYGSELFNGLKLQVHVY